MDDTLIGRTLGNYRVEARIGRGAMAEVYRAFHPGLNRSVAIKRLHAIHGDNPDLLARFQREAQNIASLSHPNIVRVFDFEMRDEFYYMVMEYVEGLTLKEVLAEARAGTRTFLLSEAVRTIHDVGLALAYAHSNDVIHRDVKPSNILVEDGGRVVLMDFGLARLTAGPQYTATGTIVGTPAYMSPEQGRGLPGDKRSDIYALGILLYEVVTGSQPFTGETPVAVIYKHINAPVPSPRAINAEIPLSLEQVIYRALEKDPDHRYQDVSDMVDELDIIARDRLIAESETSIAAQEAPPASSLKLLFHLVDYGQSFVLRGKDRYILGRLDGAFEPDLDLGPFKGSQSGVSRLHAEVEVTSAGRVQIYDMDSTNGTLVNGQKVSPTEPMILNHGDLIALGKCKIQVMFLHGGDTDGKGET